MCGTFEPLPREILMRRLTERLGETAMEMEGRQTGGRRHVVQVDGFAKRCQQEVAASQEVP